jgi:hypothetical protein
MERRNLKEAKGTPRLTEGGVGSRDVCDVGSGQNHVSHFHEK